MSHETQPQATPGYTILNLEEVKDSAPEYGYAEFGEARFASEQLGTGQTGVAFHRIKPGKRQAFGHRHEKAEEVYVVIGGSGRIALDDEVRDIGLRDAVRIGPEVTRAVEAGPEGLELLAFGARHSGDGELMMGWWPEEG